MRISDWSSDVCSSDLIADDRQGAANDPGRQRRQLVGLVADNQRMPGVMAALEAGADIGPARQPVDDLALALAAPLADDHGYVGQDTYHRKITGWPSEESSPASSRAH